MLNWYLIRTKVGSESVAEEHLQRQDYPTYCPRLISRRRRFGRRIQIISPLFPSYLFLQLAVGVKDLAPVKSTKGVVGIVRFGEEYAVAPQAVIEGLRQHEDPAVQSRRVEDPLKPQARIRITGGPLNHLEGIFLNECADDRVNVLLNILGRETSVEVPDGIVELCS